MGKTTLLELAVAALRQDGRKVLALKSSHHRLIDKEGSDSHKLAQAGAHGVGLRAVDGCQLFLDPPPALEELLALLAGRFEMALIEGGKSSSLPKVELLAGEPALLSVEQVVGRLRRGVEPGDLRPVHELLGFLERKGQLVAAAKL